MRWNGRTYSLDRLYTLRDNGKSQALKDYGPLTLPSPTFPDKYIRALNFKATFSPNWPACTNDSRILHGRTNVLLSATSPSQSILTSSPSSYPSRDSSGGRRAVVIDLHRPMLVSHVGVAGARPRAFLFPKQSPASRRQAGRKAEPPVRGVGGRKQRGSRRKKARGGSVHVVEQVPSSTPPLGASIASQPPRTPRAARTTPSSPPCLCRESSDCAADERRSASAGGWADGRLAGRRRRRCAG